MKILHITDGIPPATLGGSGRIVCDLAAEQVKRAAAAGANQICLRPQVADKARFFRTWRERVMSHLS